MGPSCSWDFITRSEYDTNGDLQVVSEQISVSAITIPLPDDWPSGTGSGSHLDPGGYGIEARSTFQPAP